jgi:hypothetical protein
MPDKPSSSKAQAQRIAIEALNRARDRVQSGVDIREIKITREKSDSNRAAVKALVKASLKQIAKRYGESKF